MPFLDILLGTDHFDSAVLGSVLLNEFINLLHVVLVLEQGETELLFCGFVVYEEKVKGC